MVVGSRITNHGSTCHGANHRQETVSPCSSFDTPCGPFAQETRAALNPGTREIDAHLFIDDDGRRYLYFVRLDRGNRVYAAEMNEDLQSLREDSAREVIHADQPWENSAGSDWPVTEAPSVVKHNGVYYLFYTANDFRNPDSVRPRRTVFSQLRFVPREDGKPATVEIVGEPLLPTVK